MTKNTQISKTAWQFARGVYAGPSKPFYCLRLVRLIVEKALGVDFYGMYGVARTSQERPKDEWGREDMSWFASDIEASMKRLKLAIHISQRQPGDLIFNYKAATPYGHVGVLIDSNTVLENVDPSFRQNSIIVRPNMCLTPINDIGHTLIARIK
jgi:cell wall-associated NlpC family hydrolase